MIDPLLETPAAEQWKRIGTGHHHGLCAPLFSVHSERSHGIGEYPDLVLLIDLVKSFGMDTLQLLPLNDTGLDPSPYSAISAFALNPVYLRLDDLPPMGGHRVDYAAVRQSKYDYLTAYCERHADDFASDPDYQTFVANNPWLAPYARFKTLRFKHNRKPWWEWPDENIDQLAPIHSILQYLCHRQMEQVRAYADSQGVLLMGDLPILVSKNSCDVWSQPHYFRLDEGAGCPPDKYAPEGQNWGLPLHNWEAQAADDFSWWRQRLNHAARYFHLYRIDHTVGLFRLWGIPPGGTPIDGSYQPNEPNAWERQGKALLTMLLAASPMLPVAEDLGTIPDVVRDTLAALGIPGTKMIRWERIWDQYHPLGAGADFRPASLSTLSTHDSELTRQWWEAYPSEAKICSAFHNWTYSTPLPPKHHRALLHESHHTASRFHVNLLSEYLALFPNLSPTNPADERINTPGTLSETNWTYRFGPTLEQLLDNTELQKTVREML